ncbi:DUF2271 domain-containing protein [Deinococcus depolymerans]|uniref:DUF2271 domain-containing protein n=1 Tax=Deinococcus depolymerans TaxID=392408 RepID=A0ABP3LV42_9DEIO
MTTDRRSFLHRAGAALTLLTLAPRAALAQSAPALPASMELAVTFTVAPPTTPGRYHKPYVAVWIETEDGKPVRTLTLWRMQDDKGKKWLSELRRWFRSNGTLDTTSSATRNPGTYSLAWDGLTDAGRRAPQDRYVLLIEAAREKGPYGRVRVPVTLAAAPARFSGPDNGEVTNVSAEYRAR